MNFKQPKAQVIMILVAIALFVIVGTAKAQVYQTTSISITGTINDLPCDMNGATVFAGSTPPTLYTNTWTYSDALIAPVLDCLDWAVPPDDWGEPDTNSTSILQLSGGSIHIHREAKYLDSHGKEIGQISLDGDLTRTSDSTSTFIANRSGTYTGPTNIVKVSGFTLSLHQQAEGHIVGNYTTSFTTSIGEVLTRYVTVDYTYSGSVVLPRDAEEIVTINARNWDPTTQTLTYIGTGMFQLVTAAPTQSQSGLTNCQWGLIILGCVALTLVIVLLTRKTKSKRG